MLGPKSLALCALATTATTTTDAASASTHVHAPSFKYKFDAASAAGIDGVIKVKYDAPMSSTAKISAELDFTLVDLRATTAFDGNCSSEIVDARYDPTKACGPNSEYAATPECLDKIPSYACTPTSCNATPAACEKGDLSGKFGSFKLNANKTVALEWVDRNDPLPSENTPRWNMVLHGVCGKFTPRVACAVGVAAKQPLRTK